MSELVETARTALVVVIFYFAALTVNTLIDGYFTIKERKNP